MSFPFNSSFSGNIALLAMRQGAHQVAQKSTRITLPRYLEMMDENSSSLLTSPTSLMVNPYLLFIGLKGLQQLVVGVPLHSDRQVEEWQSITSCSAVSGVNSLMDE